MMSYGDDEIRLFLTERNEWPKVVTPPSSFISANHRQMSVQIVINNSIQVISSYFKLFSIEFFIIQSGVSKMEKRIFYGGFLFGIYFWKLAKVRKTIFYVCRSWSKTRSSAIVIEFYLNNDHFTIWHTSSPFNLFKNLPFNTDNLD